MDGQAFDALVKATSEAASRRGALGLLLGGVVTAALARIEPALARKKGKGKNKKKKKCRKLNQGCGGKKKKCCKGLTCTDGTCLTPSACIDDSVQAAIDDAKPGTTLTLCAGTFTETIVIAKNLTLIGSGDGAGTGNTILDGAGAGTVVRIEAGSTVTLQHLRITGGDNGAAGGGILNLGTLALTGCTVIGNTSGGGGGGILNAFSGTLTLTDCAVIGNTATDGAGISNSTGTMELINSTVSGNTANDNGGGVSNVGTVELIDSSVTANSAGSAAGGISNGGTVICSGSSTVSDNTEGDPPVRSNCVDAGGTGCATCPG